MMNYGIFDLMATGEWGCMEHEPDQTYMERTFARVCDKPASGEKTIVNDMLNPTFVECVAQAASLTLAFKVEDWMCNPSGTLHGGLLTTCIDVTMGTLTRFKRGGKAVSTVDLHVNFLRPVPQHSIVVICAHVNKLGNRLVFLSGTGILESNKGECCTASGIFI